VSAGFEVTGEIVWGTNGAIEAYLDCLADASASLVGAEDRMSAFFRDERAMFNMGAIVRLDALLANADARPRLLAVFDLATTQLQASGILTDYGMNWLDASAPQLRKLIASA